MSTLPTPPQPDGMPFLDIIKLSAIKGYNWSKNKSLSAYHASKKFIIKTIKASDDDRTFWQAFASTATLTIGLLFVVAGIFKITVETDLRYGLIMLSVLITSMIAAGHSKKNLTGSEFPKFVSSSIITSTALYVCFFYVIDFDNFSRLYLEPDIDVEFVFDQSEINGISETYNEARIVFDDEVVQEISRAKLLTQKIFSFGAYFEDYNNVSIKLCKPSTDKCISSQSPVFQKNSKMEIFFTDVDNREACL